MGVFGIMHGLLFAPHRGRLEDALLNRSPFFFYLMTTFLLTRRTNSGITMTYADLGNVPLFGLCSLRMCMVGMHQG
jgi:hypothetical protein